MFLSGINTRCYLVKWFIYLFCLQRATKIMQEMEVVGVKPNVRTYTTLIHGWARASLPEKALKCFEEMKLAGLKPDKAVYHCLMTSLLSRATVAEEYMYTGIVTICSEMVKFGLTVDMGTAVHWSKCLRKIESTGGEITETLQKTFPPDWNSQSSFNAISDIEDSTEGNYGDGHDYGRDDTDLYYDSDIDADGHLPGLL